MQISVIFKLNNINCIFMCLKTESAYKGAFINEEVLDKTMI